MLTQPRGGMEFTMGKVVDVPPPPPALPGQPLRLHVGLKPIVSAEEKVQAGQHLTKPEDEGVSAHISPIPGHVSHIHEVTGGFDIHVVPEEPRVPTQVEHDVPKTRKLGPWLEAIHKLGPCGESDGRVGLLAQLEASAITRPDTVICIGVDGFPPYPAQSSLLHSFADEAVQGTQLLAEITGADHAYMLLGHDRSVRRAVKPRCKRTRVKMILADSHYASTDPSLVIWNHTSGKRRLRRTANPLEQRVLIVSPWTVIRLGRWLSTGLVDLARPIFLCWPEVGTPMEVAYAFSGQPVANLNSRVAAAVLREPHRVVFGNPLTGWAAHVEPSEVSEDMANMADIGEREPAVPDCELMLSLLEPPVPQEQVPCITCGWCCEVCPTSLRPAQLFEKCRTELRKNEIRLREELNWCIECGLCSHVCPSNLPLTKTFKEKFKQLDESLNAQRGR